MVVSQLVKNYFSRRSSLQRITSGPGRQNDITPGLVPTKLFGYNLDGGLYATPDTPASPTDCTRYPDSPFCGGMPLSPIPVGIIPEIINTDCDIGIRLNPTLAFIRLPPVALVYRKPECRKNPKTPPIIVEGQVLETDCGIYGVFGESLSSSINLHAKQILECRLMDGAYIYENTTVENWYISYVDCFGVTSQVWNQDAGLPKVIDWSQSSVASYRTTPSSRPPQAERGGKVWISTRRIEVFEDGSQVHRHPLNKKESPCPCVSIPPPPPNDPCMNQTCCPCDDTLLKLLNKKLDKLTAILGGNLWTDVGKTVTLNANVETQIKAKGTKIFGDDFSKNETVKITNLIDYILNIVAVNYHRSGLHKLPAEMPQRLIYPNGTGQEKLTDLVEMFGFQVKQVDRAVGYLPQKIKVADTNPGLAGNQSVEVEIHSFADFSREVLQYLIDTEGDGDTTNNMLVRCLYELGFIHQGVVQGDAMLDAIVDHMDFKHRWKKVRIPFAFDPYAGQKGKVGQGFDKQQNNADTKTEEAVENLLPKLLTNTEVDVRILVNDEKKSLNDLLQDIKRDTAVAAAAVAEKSTPERLEQLVAAAQLMLQLQNAIDRRNMRQALGAGNLKTRRIKK